MHYEHKISLFYDELLWHLNMICPCTEMGCHLDPQHPTGGAIFKSLHTEKTFRNLIESNRNKIVITIFRLIWNQTENGKYNQFN